MKRRILVLVLILVICVVGYKIDSLSKNIISDALEQTQKNDVKIVKMIEDSISLCSVQYDYEDCITRRKTWVLGLNPSTKYAKFEGKIKVGCEIKSVKKESNKFLIVLSEPSIVQHEIKRTSDWQGKEGVFNNFPPDEEGKVLNEQKMIIEKRCIEELEQKGKNRNKELISDLLLKFGEKKDSFDITYVKK